MNFVFIVFELVDKMLTLSSMENLIAQCSLNMSTSPVIEPCHEKTCILHMQKQKRS